LTFSLFYLLTHRRRVINRKDTIVNSKCESGGTGRRTGLRIQPVITDRGSSPLSRTSHGYKPKFLNLYQACPTPARPDYIGQVGPSGGPEREILDFLTDFVYK
jgi:hypothetical protein